MVINSINEELLEITFNPIKESLNVLTKISVAHFSRLLKNMVILVKKKFRII